MTAPANCPDPTNPKTDSSGQAPAQRKPPRKYGLLLLLPGLGIITGYCVLGALGRNPSESLPLTLAMRRNEVEPGSSLRVVTGLVLLVYAASLTQGVLVELSQISRPTSPTQEYRLTLNDVTPEQRARVLACGMILGLVIGVAAFIVSVADRAMKRRGQVTALALLGARPATLRTARCAQVLLPLTIGLTAALVAGRLAESSYLITGGGDIFWDADGLPLLLASALGGLVTAGLASVPLVRRHVDPEHIRRD